jgi:hypothetical protein
MRCSILGVVALGVVTIAALGCSSARVGTDAGTDAAVDDAGAYDPRPVLPSWMTDARVLVSGHEREEQWDCRTKLCRHNENVDMVAFKGAHWLVHRTARSQTLGPNSSLHVLRSTDSGKTFADTATIVAPKDRDLRDPHFYVVGSELWLKALTRLPIVSDRDSNVDTVTVVTHSSDGVSWAPLQNAAAPTWSLWRVLQHAGVYYSAAYEDGDKSVVLYSSADGAQWAKGAPVYTVSADTPLETELVFMPSGRMLALVRTDGTDSELLGVSGRLRTQICSAMPPYDTFTCPAVFDGQRLDGPLAFSWNSRVFVVARKHLQDGSGRKRTALFELTGTLEGGPLGIKEWGEIPSAGDTAYAGYAMVDANRAVLGWYSGDLYTDRPWVIAMFDITDI